MTPPLAEHHALQRVVVRLLHDPTLVARVYAGEDLPEIGPAAHAWIRAVDRRAWGVDRYRASRVLHALIEEFPVAVAARGVGGLDAFFTSPAFHTGVQARRHLALAFGAWLGDEPFARLETHIARTRRVQEGQLAAGVGVLTLPAGTLDAWSAARARLGPEPLGALLGGARATAPTAGTEHVLVGPAGEVGTVSADLFHVLAAAAAGRDVLAAARRRGASRAEAAALVAELRDDGLLLPRGPRAG